MHIETAFSLERYCIGKAYVAAGTAESLKSIERFLPNNIYMYLLGYASRIERKNEVDKTTRSAQAARGGKDIGCQSTTYLRLSLTRQAMITFRKIVLIRRQSCYM